MQIADQAVQLYSLPLGLNFLPHTKLCVLSVCDAAIRKEFHINSATKEKFRPLLNWKEEIRYKILFRAEEEDIEYDDSKDVVRNKLAKPGE